jgi:aryl-alcohol dehydrogenase-like predicted oxidoreductase
MSISVDQPSSLRLGLGLIGIGRSWGVAKTDVPNEAEVFSFLEYAVRLGVTFFDTAPAYGLSERRFGTFLRGLAKAERDRLFVATKFGEHWDPLTQSTYVNHSYPALLRSLETSFELLGGRVELVQVHKATLDVLKHDDVHRALERATALGVPRFGASASDPDTLNFASNSRRFAFVQMPLNARNTQFTAEAHHAIKCGKSVIVNRPFGMGQLLEHTQGSADDLRDRAQLQAFEYICSQIRKGVVLTGTKNKQHLDQNVRAFQQALQQSNEV